jgi:hypothetical protein
MHSHFRLLSVVFTLWTVAYTASSNPQFYAPKALGMLSSSLRLDLSVSAKESHAQDVIDRIQDIALNHLHETDWAPGTSVRMLGKGYWCNLFVADVLREAGAATWPAIHERVGVSPTRDPVAREWADPKFELKGWKVIYPLPSQTSLRYPDILALRQSGDVVAGGGHVGILCLISEAKKAISVSSMTGAVEHNNWSFRLPDQSGFRSAAEWEQAAKNMLGRFTVRRFVGVD